MEQRDLVRAVAEEVRGAVAANAPDLLGYFQRRVKNPDDAADLLGETMLAVWKRASALPLNPEQARMWMFGIARKVMLSHQRGQLKRLRISDDLRNELRRSDVSSEEFRQEREDVRTAMAVLNQQQRELITLVHGEGFSIAQSAALLGLNPSTTRSRYGKALSLMREVLDPSTESSTPNLTGSRV